MVTTAIKENLPRLPFWEFLNEEEKKQAEAAASIRSFSADMPIDGGAKNRFGMAYVISGELRACTFSEEGREVSLFRVLENECCVMSGACTSPDICLEMQVVTITDTELLFLSPAVFAALCEQNIHVRCFVYEQMTQHFSCALWVLQQILFTGFDRRLAAFLLERSEKERSDEIKMTQEQIARVVNSVREVVARMLKQFAEDGLIENRRGRIRIIDRERLQKLL